jgi:hypothetical protein
MTAVTQRVENEMTKKEPGKPKNYYLGALDELERIELKNAATVEGIDDEIAFTRFRLKQLAKMKTPDNDEVTKCINTLCRALVTKYTIQGKNKKSIMENLGNVIKEFIPAGALIGSTILTKKL